MYENGYRGKLTHLLALTWRWQGGIFCRQGFLGHEDLAPVYASADVHVSCSHFETLGNTGMSLDLNHTFT